METISKEAEHKRIIADNATQTSKIEEVNFTRAVCKSEEVLKRFDAYVSRGELAASFKFEEMKQYAHNSRNEELDEAGLKAMECYKAILSNCWNHGKISEEEKAEFLAQAKDPKSRRLFGDCFNIFRTQGQFSLKPESFNSISELLFALLDVVQKADDLDCALKILILSQTYYCDISPAPGKTARLYLQHSIQRHPLWREKTFWVRAIQSAVKEEQVATVSHPETEQDRNMRLQNAVFGKLGTFAHNMLEFRIDRAVVEEVVSQHAAMYSLAPEFQEALKVLMKTITSSGSKRLTALRRGCSWFPLPSSSCG